MTGRLLGIAQLGIHAWLFQPFHNVLANFFTQAFRGTATGPPFDRMSTRFKAADVRAVFSQFSNEVDPLATRVNPAPAMRLSTTVSSNLRSLTVLLSRAEMLT